jgi:copper transport protein
MRRRRTAGLAMAVCLVSAGGASTASAHSTFLESTPRPGERLSTAPSRIVMLYTEPLNERLTTLRLVEARSGNAVPAAVRVSRGRRLELVPRRRLAQGAYRLDWRSVSTIDAHIREGSVGFGVGTAALGAAVDVGGSPLEGVGPLRMALRWLLYAALFLFAGGALNAAVRRPRGSPGAWLKPAGVPVDQLDPAEMTMTARRAWRRTVRSAWVALAAAAAAVTVEAADATGGFAAGAWAEFFTTGVGGWSRLGLVIALVAGALVVSQAPRAAAGAAALAFLALAMGGHASGADPRWLAVTTNLVHLLAAAIWLGGIAHIAWA